MIIFKVALLIIGLTNEIECPLTYYTEGQIALPFSDFGFQIIRETNENLSLSNNEVNVTFLQPIYTFEEDLLVQSRRLHISQNQYEIKICSLIVQSNHSKIQCKEGFQNYLINGEFNYNYTNEYSIDIETLDDEVCEFIVDVKDQQHTVVCFTTSSFKFIQIHKHKSEIILHYDHIQLQQCQRTVIKTDSIIFVSYYLCSEWIIYQIQNLEVYIFNYENYNTNQILQNVVSCTHYQQAPPNQLYLQFENFYISLYEKGQYFVTYFNNSIIFLIITKECKILAAIKDNYIFQEDGSIMYEPQFNTSGNPQKALYIFSYLILFYQNTLEVYMNNKIKQTINIPLDQIIVICSNHLLGVDSKTKQIILFKINLFHQTPLVVGANLQNKFLLEFYLDYNQDQLYPFRCQQIRIIPLNDFIVQNKIISIELPEEQNYEITPSVSKEDLLCSVPVEWSLKTANAYISDYKNISDYCKIEAHMLKNSFLFDFIETLIIFRFALLQQQNKLAFLNCLTGQIKIFYNVTLGSQVLKYRDKLIISTYDSLSIIIFDLNRIEISKIFTYQDKIHKIYLYQKHEIMITFVNLQKIMKINFSSYQLQELMFFPGTPISKPILNYITGVTTFLFQFSDSIYIQRGNQFTVTTLQGLQIMTATAQPYLCILGVLNHEINHYCLMNGKLQQVSIYPLYGFQLINPLEYKVYNKKLVIAARKNQKKYLLIYSYENDPIFGFKEAIMIGNYHFAILNGILIYFNESGSLISKKLGKFSLSYNEEVVCKNKDSYMNISFQAVSQLENTSKQITIPTIFQLTKSCQKLFGKINQANITLSSKIEKLNLEMFTSGQVESLIIRNQNPYCNASIKGPLVLQDKSIQCIFYSGYLCFHLNKTQQFVTDLRDTVLEPIPIPIKNRDLFLFAQTLQFKKELIFVILNQDSIIQSHFKYDGNAYKLVSEQIQQNQEIEQSQLNILYQKQTGSVYIFSFHSGLSLLIHSSKNIVFKIYKEPMDCQFIKNSENLYIFAIVSLQIDQQSFKIEIMKLVDTGFVLTGNASFDDINSALKNKFRHSISYIEKISIFSCEQVNDEIQADIMIEGLNELNYRFTLYIQSSNNFKLEPIQILRNPIINQKKYLTVVDSKKVIYQIVGNSNVYLYDLNDKSQVLDPIFKFDELFELYPFNTSHHLFYINQTIRFGEINFEIFCDFDEIQSNYTLEIEANNKISKVIFNLTLFTSKERENLSSISNLPIILLVFLIIILGVCFLRRKKLLKKQTIFPKD